MRFYERHLVNLVSSIMILYGFTIIAQELPEIPESDSCITMEEKSEAADSSNSEASSVLVDSILSYSVSFLGAPYVYGGIDSTGFDCSGLAYRVFNDYGIPLPRTASGMELAGVEVDRDDLQPGDLLIFDNPKHTGIYLGDGDFIHCSSYLDRGVIITPISHSNYARRYSSARRALPE